jgi:hypothetical protein
MAYSGIEDSNGKRHPGGIDYFIPDFAGNEWEDVQSPWSIPTKADRSNMLTANGWQYDTTVDGAMLDPQVCNIIYDVTAEEGKQASRCIVLGVRKGQEQRLEKTHYVLIIRATQEGDGEGSVLYERVGAGYMPGKCIVGDVVKVHVQ